MPTTESQREAIHKRVQKLDFNPANCETETVRQCNLCGSDRFCVLAWVDRYGYDTPFNLCLGCGLGFLSPRLTAEEYGRFYGDIYRPLVSAYHGRLIDAVTVQDEQQQYTQDLIRFLLPRLSGSVSRLIDLGGSTGVVAKGVVDALDCSGLVLDPSPDELEQAAALGLETVCCLLEDYDVQQSGNADLALLCQTVDHLLDIKTALRKIHEMLNPGGWFFVDFVDVLAIAQREQRIEQAIKVDHPYYLTRQTMEAYLALTGFDVRAMTVLPDGHHVGYLCQKAKPVPADDFAFADTEWLMRALREVQAKR